MKPARSDIAVTAGWHLNWKCPLCRKRTSMVSLRWIIHDAHELIVCKRCALAGSNAPPLATHGELANRQRTKKH